MSRPSNRPEGIPYIDDDLRFEMEIGPVMHPTKRGKPEKSMPLLLAYETVIEDMAGKCDYEKDADTVAALDTLEKIYTALMTDADREKQG